jgi:hypothetical protein
LVIEMTHSVWVTGIGAEFDDFLFAPIAVDENGTQISVITALARLDLDPWQEAKQLAASPGGTATQRLKSLLTRALSDGPATTLDAGRIAARLNALLPRGAKPSLLSLGTGLSLDQTTKLGAGISMYVVLAVCIMLVAQSLLAGRQTPVPVDNGAPTPSAVSSPLPPPTSGRPPRNF